MATAMRYDDMLPTIGDLAVGDSGYVPHDALWVMEGRTLVLDLDAPVMADEDPWAILFVIRTAAGFLVDATHCDRRATGRVDAARPSYAPVIAMMHGDELLR